MSLYAGRDALANLYPTKGDECHSCPTMVAECGHIDSSDTATSPTLLAFLSSPNLSLHSAKLTSSLLFGGGSRGGGGAGLGGPDRPHLGDPQSS